MIGEEVTVTVLGVKGNQVRIGVNAPKSISVHREEIFERIKNEQQEAGRNGLSLLPRASGPPRGPSPLPTATRSVSSRVCRKGRRRAFPVRYAVGELAEWSKAHPC